MEAAKTSAKKIAKKPSAKAPQAHGVGRRKKSVARVWLRRGGGTIRVNGKVHTTYFDTAVLRDNAAAAFGAVPNSSQYDMDVNVRGGGKHGQSDAIKLGIARAFLALDEGVRVALRKHGLLTVDARVKERKKYGQRGARRKFQFVKR